MRFYDDFRDRWGFLSDHVDPLVIEIVEKLARGNLKRVLSRMASPLSVDTMYRCMNFDSVGEGVAVDFETAVSAWIYQPNFDTPPYPPPADLAPYFKEHIGTGAWLADQLGMKKTDVSNGLAGRSKRHESVIREFAEDFYRRRENMDTPNENYEAEYEQYLRDLHHRAWHCYVIAKELYDEARTNWMNSEAKAALDARVRRGEDRWKVWSEMYRQGIDVVMETHGFQSWCEGNKRLIWLESYAPLPRKPSKWHCALLHKRLNP
jgi:hypothetical protein